MSSGILKKNQKFLWVRCLAGFSGSVAQQRFACLPLAAFLDRAFQLRCRLLKANIQAARVSESRLFWIGLFSFAVACLKPIYRRHALARAARRGNYFRQDKWDICDIRDGWDADEAQSDVCFSVPIRTHPHPHSRKRGLSDRLDRSDRSDRGVCATDNNNRLYRSVSRSARGTPG